MSDNGKAAVAATERTDDALLGGRVRLWQPVQGFRAAVDSVLLAAAVAARDGEKALEAGAGAGAASLCLAVRVPGVSICALERDAAPLSLLRENIARNGMDERIAACAGDVAHPEQVAAADSFHHVFANPPYLDPVRADPPPDAAKARAHVEDGAGLSAWIAAAKYWLRAKGAFTLIHRADRLDEALALLRAEGFGGITVIPIWPRQGEAAKRVILRARKGSRAGLALAPGLALHEAGSAYTQAAEAILRQGAGLP